MPQITPVNSAKVLLKLCNIAREYNIVILPADCPECRAITLKSPAGKYYIGIHKGITSKAELLYLLAHEIGHILADAFYSPTDSPEKIERAEIIASFTAQFYIYA